MPRRITPKAADEKLIQVERQKWNVPNWRNAKEYEAVNFLDEDGLRWEFLRRDQDYRRESRNSGYAYIKYDLNTWHDPSLRKAPKFIRACHLVEFSQRSTVKQALHYQSLADASKVGALIFCVDIDHPIKPQLKFIKKTYESIAKRRVSPEDRRKRSNRRNNKNGRSPALLLRVLDADNEQISIAEIATILAGKDSISESAVRRTIEFAKGFWRRI